MQNLARGGMFIVLFMTMFWLVCAVPINKKTLAAHFTGSRTGRIVVKIYSKIKRLVEKVAELFGVQAMGFGREDDFGRPAYWAFVRTSRVLNSVP